ncbi:MAG: hypothetical protein ACLGSD_08375 [Acidobacteriota bacterium]
METMIPDTQTTLTPSFDAARTQFNRLVSEAARLHDSIQVCDETSRAAFNAVSRIQAFADQIDLILALMKEDVRVVEELSDAPQAMWAEQYGDSFQQWLKSSRGAAMKVN